MKKLIIFPYHGEGNIDQESQLFNDIVSGLDQHELLRQFFSGGVIIDPVGKTLPREKYDCRLITYDYHHSLVWDLENREIDTNKDKYLGVYTFTWPEKGIIGTCGKSGFDRLKAGVVRTCEGEQTLSLQTIRKAIIHEALHLVGVNHCNCNTHCIMIDPHQLRGDTWDEHYQNVTETLCSHHIHL